MAAEANIKTYHSHSACWVYTHKKPELHVPSPYHRPSHHGPLPSMFTIWSLCNHPGSGHYHGHAT